MVLSNPFPGHTTLTTFADLRRDLEGLVVRNSAGVMRAGVFPDHLNPLVTGRSDMKVNIGDFRAVQNRGGAVLLANVGTDTSVTLPAAPGANKRIDLIYVTMRSAALADAASTPIFGFVQGTASATPVAPSLPANLSTAIPLATVEIPAGATTTLSAGVIITQVYPYTALSGGTVVVRNSVELAAWTPADGARAFCISDAIEYERRSSTWGGGGIHVSRRSSTAMLIGAAYTDLGGASLWTSEDTSPSVTHASSRWTVSAAGVYRVSASFAVAANNLLLGIGRNLAAAPTNPTDLLTYGTAHAVQGVASVSLSTDVKLAAGGWISLYGLASAAGTASRVGEGHVTITRK